MDCRALYPDRLWAELTWTPDVLLSQSLAPPAGEDTSLIDALAPAVDRHYRDAAGLGTSEKFILEDSQPTR